MACDRRDLAATCRRGLAGPGRGLGIRVVGGEQHLGHIVEPYRFDVISVLVEVDGDPRCGKGSKQVLVPPGRDQQPRSAAGLRRTDQRRDDLVNDCGGSVASSRASITTVKTGLTERIGEACAVGDAKTVGEFGEQLGSSLASCQQCRSNAGDARHRAGIRWKARRLRRRAMSARVTRRPSIADFPEPGSPVTTRSRVSGPGRLAIQKVPPARPVGL